MDKYNFLSTEGSFSHDPIDIKACDIKKSRGTCLCMLVSENFLSFRKKIFSRKFSAAKF